MGEGWYLKPQQYWAVKNTSWMTIPSNEGKGLKFAPVSGILEIDMELQDKIYRKTHW